MVGSIGSIGAGAQVNIGTDRSAILKPASPVRKVPHFEFVGLARRELFISPKARHGVHEPTTAEESEHTIVVFTAKFTNLAQKDGSSLKGFNVIASLRFFTEIWTSYKDVEYGVWIGSSAESTCVDVGHTEELFLISNDDGLLTLRDRRKNSLYYSQGDNFAYIEAVDINSFPHVQVVLTDGGSQESRSWIWKLTPQGTSFILHDAHPPATATLLPH